MATIAIYGGTGYAGGHILDQAVARGHNVIAIARNAVAARPNPQLEVRPGSLHDPDFVRQVARDADVVVIAIHAHEIDNKRLIDALPSLSAAAVAGGARLGFVGGAGSLWAYEGGPKVVDLPDFPAVFKDESLSHAAVLDALLASDAALDWFYVSPANTFGAYAPGETTGAYRLGGDVLVSDADGNSEISGTDFALAFIDEIDRPKHQRARFTVAH